MCVRLDDNFYDFPFVKKNAVFVVANDSELRKNISKLLSNNKFRNELISNGENFVQDFLHEPMHASKCLSNEIKSILEKN